MEYIRVTKENLEKEHICYNDNKTRIISLPQVVDNVHILG